MNAEQAEGGWLTVEEVAKRLQVDPETVRRWVRGRKLGALDLGSKKAGYRIRPADLETFIAARFQPAHQDEEEAR